MAEHSKNALERTVGLCGLCGASETPDHRCSLATETEPVSYEQLVEMIADPKTRPSIRALAIEVKRARDVGLADADCFECEGCGANVEVEPCPSLCDECLGIGPDDEVAYG